MKLNDLYYAGKNILKNFKIDNFEFDTFYILKECFGIDRHYLILNGNNQATKNLEDSFLNLINRRALGEPLQYILGNWEFMGLKFKVGKGVLIPREDTSILVKECLNLISHLKQPKILDLCAGSGAIGITLAKLKPNSEVVCIECSNEAYQYLIKNIKFNCTHNIKAIQGNIFSYIKEIKDIKFDLIVSNPPYIKTKDIKNLSAEVKNEPKIALDGGKDGLVFYREIIFNWKKNLKLNSSMAVEIGIGQKKTVYNFFNSAGFSNINFKKDINGIYRVVSGIYL